MIGLEESGRDGQSVYLRCWGDFFFHSLQLTEADAPGLGHIAWRAEGPAAARAGGRGGSRSAGAGEGWSRGPARARGPPTATAGRAGTLQELFWEVERYQAPAEKRSAFPARPQRHTRARRRRRGSSTTSPSSRATRIGDSEWYRDNLGFRFMEYTGLDENPDLIVFSMVTTNEKSHDLGLVVDFSGVPGRIHHLAFWVDAVEDVLRAADLLMENGVHIEFGPGKHGMGEQTYLYFREPGGLRLEVNSGGYRIYQPDWEPVKWVPSQGSNTMYRNLGCRTR